MTRNQFEHVVRAAGAILGTDEILVIGSQAVHGSVAGDLPDEAERSVEADVAAIEDPSGASADLIDGSIGELSMFHETFGYYAHGVTEASAVLPPGWRERLARFETPATNGVAALCLELHDLWLSKAVANRPRDREFCRALVTAGLVEPNELERRLTTMDDLDESARASVFGLIRAD